MADQTTYDHEIVKEPCDRAPLNHRWVFKLGVIAFVVFLVGLWGLWDATSVYPARGERYADWARWQYLEAAKDADSEDFGIFIREASVENPQEELARLSKPEKVAQNRADANNPASSRTLRAAMQDARLEWLKALKVIGMLDPRHTVIESPQRELEALRTRWSAEPKPKPLHTLDLLVQWLIFAVCMIIALIMLVHMLRVRTKRYAWDPGPMALTLPGGATVTPEDLEEVDKRKWDKFIVFLKIKPGHEKLGDQEVAVDTYQHARVEDWVLAMEEKAFGSQEQTPQVAADAAATPPKVVEEPASDESGEEDEGVKN